MSRRSHLQVLAILILVAVLTFWIGRWTKPEPAFSCPYCEGRMAAKAGLSIKANPYLIFGYENSDSPGLRWAAGWSDGMYLARRKDP
jgi:hypothetical protein